jgi:hypothetical protein
MTKLNTKTKRAALLMAEADRNEALTPAEREQVCRAADVVIAFFPSPHGAVWAQAIKGRERLNHPAAKVAAIRLQSFGAAFAESRLLAWRS